MINKLIFIIGLLCLLFSSNNLIAQQTPQILVYDFDTKTMDTLSSFAFDGNVTCSKTDNYQGLKNSVNLDLSIPQENLVEKTKFTYQIPAAEIFEKIAYPLSTSVKFVIPNRKDRHQCTGVMISENFVLSSTHCVIDPYENTILVDELDAIAGYDESLDASQNLRARVKRIYFIKDWNIGLGEDLALYELEYPVGLFSGWMSIGFESDQTKVEGKVMHKMSYPAYNTPLNKNDFNGNDLHISYGVVDYVVPEYIGIKNHLVGAGGESGSPIFTTDNEDDYTAQGVLTWAGFHNHSRINAPIYFAYEDIIKNNDQVAGVVLPVELSSFEVQKEENKVLINWKAEKELSLEGYEIERSIDGQSFDYIGFVEASNSIAVQSYSFDDTDLLEGTVYYRLRSVDMDGAAEYTDVRSVKHNKMLNQELVSVNVFPNPATDYIKVESKLNIDEAKTLAIYNSNGQILDQTTFSESANVDLTEYVAGTYHLVVSSEDQRMTKTLLVQK